MPPNPDALEVILDAASAVCLLLGSLMSLAAAIGLVRFPDLLSRMHAATKPQVLGLLLLLTAVGLQLRSWAALPVLLVAWIFQLLTVPVSAHMVGRAGYRSKHLHHETLSVDELDDVVQAAALSRHSAPPRDGTEAQDAQRVRRTRLPRSAVQARQRGDEDS
jgi:multicomponent Na+:H+ antiporter subunit G